MRLNCIFYRKINFQKNAPHGTQLPNLAPRLRRRQARFGEDNRSSDCFYYSLPEIHDLGRNFYPRFWPETFCILARMRRVLRTIFRKMLHIACTFETWLQDCVAARKDLEEIIRYSDCFYYSLPGIKCDQRNLFFKKHQSSVKQPEIVTRDLGP